VASGARPLQCRQLAASLCRARCNRVSTALAECPKWLASCRSPIFAVLQQSRFPASRGASRAIARVPKMSLVGQEPLQRVRRCWYPAATAGSAPCTAISVCAAGQLPPIKRGLDNRQAIQPGGHLIRVLQGEPAGARPPARFPASRHRRARTGLRARSPPAAASDRCCGKRSGPVDFGHRTPEGRSSFRPVFVMTR